jgi:hypothetical protein
MATYDPNMRRHEASTTDKVKTAAEDTGQQVKQKAEEYADRAQERAKEVATSQKTHAAEGLGSVASAFRETGEHLREYDQGAMANTVAQYTDKLAEQVDRFAQQLRQKDVSELISDVENMARQQPAIFLGSAFAAGILLARFLKSSGARHELRTRRTYYGSEQYNMERARAYRPMGTSSGYSPTTTTATSTRTTYGEESPVRETPEERPIGGEGPEYG